MIIREVDDLVVVNNDHSIWTANKAIALMGRIFSNELSWREELDSKARNVDSMNMHHYWKTLCVGESPIDIANSSNS